MIYVAHEIRGCPPHTDEQRRANLLLARKAAARLRRRFPKCEFYVPAEHDDFPQACLDLGQLSVGDVLSVDLEILENCSQLFVLLPKSGRITGGVAGEVEHALRKKIPVRFIW
jgi:hypothetical protein